MPLLPTVGSWNKNRVIPALLTHGIGCIFQTSSSQKLSSSHWVLLNPFIFVLNGLKFFMLKVCGIPQLENRGLGSLLLIFLKGCGSLWCVQISFLIIIINFFLYWCAVCGYIVAFVKVLTMY
jgi:hypothetical protein